MGKVSSLRLVGMHLLKSNIQKVLLSLLAATIVAISEVGLYIIWESRRQRRQPAKTKTDRERPPAVSRADSRDVGVDTPAEPTRLDEGSSQISTSINPHQQVALRQRVGTTSKSHSG
jgi:hypothetical protein